MDGPGFSKPRHQYGAGFFRELTDALPDTESVVLPAEEGQRELDETELRELAIWERDGFTGRTAESAS